MINGSYEAVQSGLTVWPLGPGSAPNSIPLPPWLLAVLSGIGQARFDQDVWLWVAACAVGYVVVSSLFWFVPALRPWRRGTVLFAGRFFGFGIPPFLALQAGLVTSSAMGLAQVDWLRPFGVGLVVAAVLLIIFALAAWHYRVWAASAGALSALEMATAARDAVPPYLAPFLAAAEQLYWALLRVGGVAFLLMAGASAEIASYWGAWAGFGLMALCWLANPAWRATVRTPIGAYAEMTRFGILLASTVLFLFSGNLWLTWGVHMGAWWLTQFAQARLHRAVQHGAPPA